MWQILSQYAEELTALGTLSLAIVTLILALVALFGEKFWEYVTRPKLSITFNLRPPDCHKTAFGDGAPVYFLRVLVSNEGKRPAREVEVFLKDLRCIEAFGATPVDRERFLPLNLRWSHYTDPAARFGPYPWLLPSIAPGLPKHCDLAHIIHPRYRQGRPLEDDPSLKVPPQKTTLSLELIVKPHTLSHLWPPGTYELKLVAGASNAEPKEYSRKLTITGKWFDDEEEMLTKGILDLGTV